MRIVFLFYEGMTALDAIGPHEILSRIEGAETRRVAKKSGVIRTDSANLQLIAEYSLEEISHTDVLVIPGAGSATTLEDHPETLRWIRSIHETTKWTTSVCTGSLILGAAGLLTGLPATTHWAVRDRLASWGAKVMSKRVVESGKVITAAGVSAGIDMALILTEKIAGTEVAQGLQLAIEYDPKPPFDTGSFEKADPKIRDALFASMKKKFEKAK